MRTIAKFSLLSFGLFAVACSRSDSGETASGLSDELQKDLAAASAASVQLATARDYQPTRFVSAIESPVGSAPTAAAVAPRRVPRPRVAPRVVAEETSPAPEPIVEAAPTPDVEATETAPAPAPEVVTAPRPTPVAVSYPGGSDIGRGGSGPGIGEAIGVIGVLIRGGNGGVDHCEIHDRRRGRTSSPNQPVGLPRGTFPSGRMVEVRLPIGRGTFPR